MSSQKGNMSRSRPQKHKNTRAFKNTLYDKSHRTKAINATVVSHVCQRCKEIIDWKIKYKKYKPLSQPKKCVKCEQKCVKRAYHIMCDPCGKTLGVCAKCGETKDLIPAPVADQELIKVDEEMNEMLKLLPERKRRTVIRYMNKTKSCNKEDIMDKLKSLKIGDQEDDDFLNDFLSSGEEDCDSDGTDNDNNVNNSHDEVDDNVNNSLDEGDDNNVNNSCGKDDNDK